MTHYLITYQVVYEVSGESEAEALQTLKETPDNRLKVFDQSLVCIEKDPYKD